MSNNSTKRSGYNSSKNTRSYKNPRQQPCRGFPAIFFTCESGREKKCQREALELIHHYYYLSKSASTAESCPRDEDAAESSTLSKEEPLSLDEELNMLRKGAAAEEVLSYERNSKRPRYETKNDNSLKSPFVVYDVGIKGIVCIVFTLPGSELIPYNDIVAALRPKIQEDGVEKEGDGKVAETDRKKQASDSETTKQHHTWDPIETVRIIMKEVGCSEDVKDNKDDCKEKSTQQIISAADQVTSTSPPGSRFIFRMIPIQATVSI
jgi:hypothetical protein